MNSYDLIAKYYDLRPRGSLEEIDFYVQEAVKSGGPVLELGSGTGRITLPIASKKIKIVAIDKSPKMLEIAKNKAKKLHLDNFINFFEQDMKNFKINQKFPLIIIPYKTFLYLISLEEQLSCLKNCLKHLQKRGKLILDLYSPNLKIINKNLIEKPKWEYIETLLDNEKKLTIKRYDKRTYDPAEQILTQASIYYEYDKHGCKKNKTKITTVSRYIFKNEMNLLLKLAGFKKTFLYGSFKREKYTSQSKIMLWIAQN
jgi:ubiquinone/menaquinone biosynthesis C-methylase UbiE